MKRAARGTTAALCLVVGLVSTAAWATDTLVLVSDLNGRYGDTDYSPRVSAAVEAITALEPIAVISAGDMVAGQKQPELGPDRLDQMWRSFTRVFIEPLERAGIPLAVTPGNHDASAFPAFALERRHYEAHWQNRKGALDLLPGSEWPWRYGARLDGILLLSFDGTRPGRLATSEYAFLERMLERFASQFETVVVFSHLPMWPIASGRERDVIDDPDLLTLLHRYDVDAYISGHHHAFYAGRDDHGMLHIAVGALGGNSRHYSDGATRQSHSFTVMEIEDTGIRVNTRVAPGFIDPVDPERLPARIDGPLGRLTRLEASAFSP